MIRWPFRRHSKGTPDPEVFLAELAASHPGKAYKPMDRYRDFRRVFLGDEQGRRVLYELLSWGHMFRSPAKMSNFGTNETFFHEGESHFAKLIMSTMHAEPKARPERAKS